MRAVLLAGLVITGLIMVVHAEDRTTALPEIVVGGERGAGAKSDGCADTGSSRAFECLNQKLKREVDRVNPSANVAPIDAKSSDLKVGTVNVPAVRQQYGKNFGVSVIPYRPAPPIYGSPLGPRR